MKRLFKNATIIDGSGAPAFQGYVITEKDKIEAVSCGKAPEGFDGEAYDCMGLTVAPGFIDAHSHNDWFAARQNPLPFFIPFAEQGITTQVVGNCGFAPFGYDPGTPYKNLLGSGLFQVGDAQGDFSTFAGWCDSAAKLTPLNMVPLQGHGPIRIGICGYENRPLTGQEMKKRDEILERSLSDGAFGASFGLMYEPDRYATADELEGAARIGAKHGGVLTVHERACSAASTSYNPPFGGRPHNLRALDEMIELTKRTGVKMQYSHLIYVGESSWKTVEESLAQIDQVRSEGYDFCYDLYSMTFGVSVITVVLPNWYLSLPSDQRHTRWTHLKLRAMIGATVKMLGFGFDDMQVAWIGDGYETLCGKRVTEIAREWGISDLDAYIRLVDLSEGKGRLNMYRYYNDEIITRLIRHEPSIFMTDAWIEEKGVQNAAAYSCFPKFLAWSREGKGIPLEATVRKMTGAVADRFSIAGRGYLKPGYAADLTLFDAAAVSNIGDEPTRPIGIDSVYINGKCVVKDGKADERALLGAGMVIRR